MSTILMRVADFRGHFGKQVFQLSVVAALAGLGLWGHKNHWQLSSAHADGEFGHVSRGHVALPSLDAATATAANEPAVINGADGSGRLPPSNFRPATRSASWELPWNRPVAGLCLAK